MKKRILSILAIILISIIAVVILVTNVKKESNGVNAYSKNEVMDNLNEAIKNNEKYEEANKKKSPVLKNLGIDIKPLDKETNLAGDLIFSKALVYDDGRVSGDKVFVDFGAKDKYRTDSIGNVEYWYHVPLNTKIRAPIGGEVKVDYFEHTKDWGVNIHTQDSEVIVSFEHLVNVLVKDGDHIAAEDFIGEAAPRNTFNNKIAMTELAVWRGGKNITKYCPYDYLDESLKPIYKEKLEKVASEWEEFIGKEVYQQENWVAPGCIVRSIKET